MRDFYIFNIDNNIKNLFKDNSYSLFHSLNKIKNIGEEDLSIGINIYEQIANYIEINKYNKKIYNTYKDDCFYTKYLNNHSYINKYRDEKSYLYVNKSCLRIKTNMQVPDFFKSLKKFNNLFVCDFENKDFFWMCEI